MFPPRLPRMAHNPVSGKLPQNGDYGKSATNGGVLKLDDGARFC